MRPSRTPSLEPGWVRQGVVIGVESGGQMIWIGTSRRAVIECAFHRQAHSRGEQQHLGDAYPESDAHHSFRQRKLDTLVDRREQPSVSPPCLQTLTMATAETV